MTQNNPVIPLEASDLPPAVRCYWDTAPETFRIPAILTAIDCYSALGTRLRAKYVYDLDLHALLLQVIIIGEPGSGKSFTRPIVKYLMRPLRLRDQELKRQEQAYADLKKTASKNKQLPDEPITDVRCLQTITKAKLVKRADMFIRKYGEPLAFWFYNEELATMTESNKRAFADLRTMDRLAYDLGAEYGSDTLSDASYNADVDVIYCSLFCGTDNALDEYIDKRSIEGGNCTRKIVADLGDLMGDDAPRFRPLSEEETSEVNDAIDRLMDATYTDEGALQPIHIIPMGWIDDVVKTWCQEQRQRVLKTGSRALNCFYKRSSVSAWRMACLLYYLWGETQQSRPKVIKFYQFMAHYILEGLLSKWGRRYELMHKNDDVEEGPHVPLYDQLPKRFSRDQLREMVIKLDLSCPVRTFLFKWRRAKLIHEVENVKELYEKNY